MLESLSYRRSLIMLFFDILENISSDRVTHFYSYIKQVHGIMSQLNQSNTTSKRTVESTVVDTSLNVNTPNFKDLGINNELLARLDQLGFKQPTPIQSKTIPVLLEGRDLIAQAKTGSGKTLAFALPTLQRVKKEKKMASVLVLTPTRELAQQISDVYQDLAKGKRVNTACVVGRESYTRQIEAVNRGAQIVIATPGRLLDLLKTKRFKTFAPQTIIFDEADEMLNMGFIEDIRSILDLLPEKRQTIFFSATFPPQILRLATAEQHDPEVIRINQDKQQASPSIEQRFYILNEQERKDAIIRLFEFEQPSKAIIFCRTKSDTEILQSVFVNKKYKSKVLHGDLSQPERTRTIRDFKSGVYKVLIATDVASRGLDVDDLSHVFNFHVPENFDRYTHRIGRTGRAGRTGKAFTLTTTGEWSSHFFLRKLDLKNVIFSHLPNRKKVEDTIKNRLLEKVQATDYTPDTKLACEKIVTTNDPFELLCKLFTMITNDHKVLGPQTIGFSDTMIKTFLNRVKKSQSRPRGRFQRSSFSRKPYSKSSFSRRKRS